MERFVSGLILTLQILLGIGVGIWGIWFVWVGFTGGIYPVPWDWTTDGSILEGLLWLLVGLPTLEAIIVQGLALIGAAIAAPFVIAAEKRAQNRLRSPEV
jgi:hypothetical protein